MTGAGAGSPRHSDRRPNVWMFRRGPRPGKRGPHRLGLERAFRPARPRDLMSRNARAPAHHHLPISKAAPNELPPGSIVSAGARAECRAHQVGSPTSAAQIEPLPRGHLRAAPRDSCQLLRAERESPPPASQPDRVRRIKLTDRRLRRDLRLAARDPRLETRDSRLETRGRARKSARPKAISAPPPPPPRQLASNELALLLAEWAASEFAFGDNSTTSSRGPRRPNRNL